MEESIQESLSGDGGLVGFPLMDYHAVRTCSIGKRIWMKYWKKKLVNHVQRPPNIRAELRTSKVGGRGHDLGQNLFKLATWSQNSVTRIWDLPTCPGVLWNPVHSWCNTHGFIPLKGCYHHFQVWFHYPTVVSNGMNDVPINFKGLRKRLEDQQYEWLSFKGGLHIQVFPLPPPQVDTQVLSFRTVLSIPWIARCMHRMKTLVNQRNN